MPKLTRTDWETLRNIEKVAFTGMPTDLFELLLDKVYGPKSNPTSGSTNPGGTDKTDAMMIYLSHLTEPPITPVILRQS